MKLSAKPLTIMTHSITKLIITTIKITSFVIRTLSLMLSGNTLGVIMLIVVAPRSNPKQKRPDELGVNYQTQIQPVSSKLFHSSSSETEMRWYSWNLPTTILRTFLQWWFIKYCKKRVVSRINWIYYWRLFCKNMNTAINYN